ncbi:hypothetical protein [Streptomyces decoyicus]
MTTAARRAGIVPDIATWSAEHTLGRLVIGQEGITYTDDYTLDRDSRGALWKRVLLRQGEGKPQYGYAHPQRQRRAMRRFLCQVCARPAHQDDRGTLWLLEGVEDEWAGWPDGLLTTNPPVCLSCAPKAVQHCPELRDGYVALRVAESEVCGVRGRLYRRGYDTQAVPCERRVVLYDEPEIRWVLAEQSVRELQSCTIVDLQHELALAT